MFQLMMGGLTYFILMNVLMNALSGVPAGITTTLEASVTASEAVLPVASTSNFPSGGTTYIGGEAIQYTAQESPCTQTGYTTATACFYNLTRGSFGTIAILHVSGAIVYDETAGNVNELAGQQEQRIIDASGEVSNPFGFAGAITGFLAHLLKQDWPVYNDSYGGYLKFIVLLGPIAMLVTVAYIFFRLLRGGG